LEHRKTELVYVDKPAKPNLNSIERSKIIVAVALELAATEMVKRLMDQSKREQIKDKDLGDWVDKAAKYVLPRDIRIRVSDPQVLQAIAAITAELLPEEVFQRWLERVSVALEGSAVSKHMATTGITIDDVIAVKDDRD